MRATYIGLRPLPKGPVATPGSTAWLWGAAGAAVVAVIVIVVLVRRRPRVVEDA